MQNISQDQEFWNVQGEAAAMLLKLGIEDPTAMPETLSGGQRKRAALAAALLTPGDILILDEPTNHLDHEMIEWLQEQLAAYKGAIVMVTHDRYFLDEVTNTIWEIDRANVYSYPGNYEKYLQTKQERLDFALAAERKMAALYKQDLAWIMRGARARSTKQKAHIRRFEALRDREKIAEERNVLLESLPSRMGNKTIEVRHLAKSYGDKRLFRDFTYTFLKNDRIGIIGPNGCGKSTLLKILIGLVPPDEGVVEKGQTIRIGGRADHGVGHVRAVPVREEQAVHAHREAVGRGKAAAVPAARADGGAERADPGRADQRPGHPDAADPGGLSGPLCGDRDRGVA